MIPFLETDIYISKIVRLTKVDLRFRTVSHVNKPDHGLILLLETPFARRIDYCFENEPTLSVTAPAIVYLPKGSNYHTEMEFGPDQPAESFYSCYGIHFQISPEGSYPPFVLHTRNASIIAETVTNTYRSWSMLEKGRITNCLARLYHVINTLKVEYNAQYLPMQQAKLIKPGISYLEDHIFETKTTVQHLADLCCMSDTYFRKLFEAVYGMLPKQYITQVRLNQAHSLLLSGENTVAEIALMCGFDSADYFSRVFKKAYGIAPGQFRQQSKG